MKFLIHGWIPKFSTSVFLFIALSGCAHTPEERQMDRKIAAEPAIADRAALEAQTDHSI